MDQVHTIPLTVELNNKPLSMEVKKWAPRNTCERGRASGVVDLDAHDEHVTVKRSRSLRLFVTLNCSPAKPALENPMARPLPSGELT